MNIWRVKIITLLIAACSVGALIYGLIPDADTSQQHVSSHPVEVPSRPVATVAANPNSANPVAPVKPAVTPMKAPLTPTQIRLAIAAEFQSAPDLKAFFDTYSSPAYAQNGAAAFYAAKAISACVLFVNKTPEAVEQTLFGNVDKNNPEAAIRISALRALGNPCKGFTGKANFADMPSLFKAAALLGDPNGLAATLLEMDEDGKKLEALELAKQLLSNPGSDMVQSLIAYFEFRVQPWTVGNGERFYPKPMIADAWRLVGCGHRYASYRTDPQ